MVRPSLFAEVRQIVPATDGQSAGLTAAVPAIRLDFLVIDPFEDTLALGLGDYTLEAGERYEVVAYQLLDSRLLAGFVLRYVPPA
ncbi:hypothetical protein HC928_14930 [bacterium]|nr:hypothetical protein [bacterium]